MSSEVSISIYTVCYCTLLSLIYFRSLCCVSVMMLIRPLVLDDKQSSVFSVEHNKLQLVNMKPASVKLQLSISLITRRRAATEAEFCS